MTFSLFEFVRGIQKVRGLSPIQKQDIPEVQAVFDVISPVARRFWLRRVERGEAHVLERLLAYSPARLEAIARDRGLREEEIAALLALLLERMEGPPTDTEARAFEDAGQSLITTGALAIGVLLAGGSPSPLMTARRDMRILLEGRVVTRTAEVTALLNEFLSNPAIQAGAGIPGAEVLAGAIPGAESPSVAFQRWRARFREVLGAEWEAWGPAVVDAWAYRWHNIGRILAGRDSGIRAWIAQNPLDNRTTRFCRWVHGRVVSMSRVNRRVRDYFDAVNAGDIERMAEIWSLSLPRQESGFRRFFFAAGAPPYHFRCRTILVPAVSPPGASLS